jgi:predicted DNA-binding protein (MmcQ/YjbR family)
MNLDRLRRYCLSLPHATENVQWGNDLVFKVAGRMFAVSCLDPQHALKVSFKCDPEAFAGLLERPGVVPAPYMARNKWVSLETFSALSDREIEDCLARSHRLIVAGLPKRTQRELAGEPVSPPRPTRKAGAASRSSVPASTQPATRTGARRTRPRN